MDCRCYRGGEGRTRLRRLKMQGGDFAAIAIFVLVFAVLIVANIFIPKGLLF